LVERRLTIRLRQTGHPVAVEAIITCTGEGGFAQAMEPALKDIWPTWRDAFENQKPTPDTICERIGKEQWRLTAEGVIARSGLDNGRSSTVFDFVLRRVRLSGRPPVGGKGVLEKLARMDAGAVPTGVTIANWKDGAEYFAAAFTEPVKANPSRPPADPPDAPAVAATNQVIEHESLDGLRTAAKALQLKGKQATIIEMLCDAGGKVPLANLAVECNWDTPCTNTWNSTRDKLNKKLKQYGYRLETFDMNAVAKRLPSSAPK
jgi:hypothetical protein